MNSLALTFVVIGAAILALPHLDRRNDRARFALFAVCIVLTWRYVGWRFGMTLPPLAWRLDSLYAWSFSTVEALANIGWTLGFVTLSRTRDRGPEATAWSEWLKQMPRMPRVDILITSYNEDEAILTRTIVGALSVDFPKSLLREIESAVTKNWVIMEICGGQTHAFLHHGLDAMLPSQIELVHGPGCPVCVTPLEQIDRAIAIAARPDVIFTSYGDMLRVPGSTHDLFTVRARGGDIRVVYSPLEAVQIAEANPEKQVVFFAIGFETTAPANAMAVLQARNKNIKNFSVLVSHVRVPPALEAILSSESNRVQAFLAAGHVCAVMGFHEYPPLAEKYRVPIVVTGFEPIDLLNGLLAAVRQLEAGRALAENQYQRAVKFEGNESAQETIRSVFVPVDRKWRGIGVILQSGWGLSPDLQEFDAEKRFAVENIFTQESPQCIAGGILQGLKKPLQCTAFGKGCTPQSPLGAPMVSAEGACAAYYKYHRDVIHG